MEINLETYAALMRRANRQVRVTSEMAVKVVAVDIPNQTRKAIGSFISMFSSPLGATHNAWTELQKRSHE